MIEADTIAHMSTNEDAFLAIVDPEIPSISDEDLADLAKRIRPVTEVASAEFGSVRRFVDLSDVDLRRTALGWDDDERLLPCRDEFEAKYGVRLAALDMVVMYFSFGAPSLFKPSAAEVLAQIPVKHREPCVGFEILRDDLGARNVHSVGVHMVPVILYTRHDWHQRAFFDRLEREGR